MNISNGNYWNNNDRGLLDFEYSNILRAVDDLGAENSRVKFGFDNDKHFICELILPMEAYGFYQQWHLLVLFEHNHPGYGESGACGGSIKIFILNSIKSGFEHTLHANGIPYMCQTRQASTENVNAYQAMQHAARWIQDYAFWIRNGYDRER